MKNKDTELQGKPVVTEPGIFEAIPGMLSGR